MVKILENLSDEEIIDINIPTGVPLVYSLDQSYNILEKKYLLDDKTLKKMQQSIQNQGKIK